MGLNDTAWEKLFDKYQILDRVDRDGQFQISASQIKEFREPRLMTKFDHRVNLPAIFRKHNLAILPVTRGTMSSLPFPPIRTLRRRRPRYSGSPSRPICKA